MDECGLLILGCVMKFLSLCFIEKQLANYELT